jgi:hypothetical protein
MTRADTAKTTELSQMVAKLRAAGVLPASSPEHKVAEQNANAFEAVASRIFRDGGFDKEGMPSWPPGLIPLVVNGAFAAELYLKAIHGACGAKATGHDLRKLYDNLPPNALAAVAAARSELYVGKPTHERSVSEVLEHLKGAFVDFRYAHEADGWLSADVEELMHVLRALRKACVAMG